MFEATKVTSQALAINLTKLLYEYWLRKKCFVYVKDKGSNLNVLTTTLKFAVSCQCLPLDLKNFKALVLAMIFVKLANMWQHMKKIAKIEIYFYQVSSIRFT